MMMTRTASCLLLILFNVTVGCAVVSGTGGVKNRDLDRDHLFGPVHQVVTKSRASTTVATYDRAGMLQEYLTRTQPTPEQSEVGEQLQKFIYTYGWDGKRLREMTEEGDGQQYLSRLYAYDASGKKIAEAIYLMCGTFSALVMYSYDANGWLREALTFQYRSIVRQVYDYDQRGRMRSRAVFKNNALQSTTRFDYVERVYPIAEETANVMNPSLNDKSVSMYEYDAQGNWTKKTTRRLIMPIDEDGKPMLEPIEIRERMITYF